MSAARASSILGTLRRESGAAISDFAALLLMRGLNVAFPLLAVPHLSRALGPEAFGVFSIAASAGQILVVLLEFGTFFSATREVAQYREDRLRIARTVSATLAVQVSLAAICITLCAVFWFLRPDSRYAPPLLAASVWSMAQATNLIWLYQGLSRVAQYAMLDAISKLCALTLIYGMVRGPGDWWLGLVVPAAATMSTTILALWALSGDVPIRLPTGAAIRHQLSTGRAVYQYRVVQAVYTAGNSFLFSFVAGPVAVSLFAGADRISRACIHLMDPVHHFLYPRVSRLAKVSPAESHRLARSGLLLQLLATSLLGIACAALAPYAVPLLLGEKFRGSVPVLRILCWNIPVTGLSYSLLWYFLLPNRRDAHINRIILAAAVLSIAGAFTLGRRFGPEGMAASILLAELLVVACCSWLAVRGRKGWLCE